MGRSTPIPWPTLCICKRDLICITRTFSEQAYIPIEKIIRTSKQSASTSLQCNTSENLHQPATYGDLCVKRVHTGVAFLTSGFFLLTDFHTTSHGYMTAHSMQLAFLEALQLSFKKNKQDPALFPAIMSFLSHDLPEYLRIEEREEAQIIEKYSSSSLTKGDCHL